MIRSVHIPRGVSRMGASPATVAYIGSGGSYTSYSFDPTTGLSNDPSLPSYLQDLTPAQLQSALNGGDTVTSDLSSLLIDDTTGTGAGYLPSGAALTTAASSVPMWAWIAGGGILAFAVLKR
jgi:hypothetical protein